MQNTDLTTFESQVVEYLKECDTYDERHYAHILDIEGATKIPIKQLRGILSSLDQKKILYVDHDFFRKGDTIVFLF
ncbi:hypothetical protein [Olivibacter sitiensis]|uniref:hypothetical protein n=1 Tax=Olivibacter sitiensis TaxID=376470 RepID=UPI00055FCDEC|nr:hypothetical protein [Olivibacter sitiensis]